MTTECLKNDLFKSTVLIGRRNVKYDEDFYNKGVQKVIDFDKIHEFDDAFKGLDVVYCCLGTTRGKSGAVKKIFYILTHESYDLLIELIYIRMVSVKSTSII